MHRTAVLNVVGLTRGLLGPDTPNLLRHFPDAADIETVTPAVTCTVQSTFLTGELPRSHGIVGNGWYFRDLSEIFFWRQSNRLVQGEKLWQAGKRRHRNFTCANLFWWYNMATEVDWCVTPRPLYCADGRKLPDCYSIPPDLRTRFNRDFGQFPLFQFWGPATSISSSRWIAQAAMAIEDEFAPTLSLVYIPHLDYVLQREGPSGAIGPDLREVDALCGELISFYRERGCRTIVLSEYGITPVSSAVHPNRILRAAGFLAVKEDLGREYLDPGASRAFAVADHQVAHIYVRDPRDVAAVSDVFRDINGVDRVLDDAGKRDCGLDHERSGELVLVADANAWFTYYFWNDDKLAPDYARTVNIHAKPGYDPCELFIDPQIPLPRLKIATTLLRKILGFRYLMDVIPLDASLVRGSHGRVTDRAEDGPLLMTTDPRFLDTGSVHATEIRRLIERHVWED